VRRQGITLKLGDEPQNQVSIPLTTVHQICHDWQYEQKQSQQSHPLRVVRRDFLDDGV
jgi:hypothetical protein